MNIEQLRNEFVKQLQLNETPIDAIEFLSNDVHTLLWVNHVHVTEKMSIFEMFGDVGFCEFLQLQFANPIKYDEMK